MPPAGPFGAMIPTFGMPPGMPPFGIPHGMVRHLDKVLRLQCQLYYSSYFLFPFEKLCSISDSKGQTSNSKKNLISETEHYYT